MKVTKEQIKKLIREASQKNVPIDDYLESIGFDVDPSMVDLLFVLKPFGFMVKQPMAMKGKMTLVRPAKMHRTGTMIFDDLDVYDSGEVDLLIRYPHSKYVGFKSLEQAAMELPAILQKQDDNRRPNMAESTNILKRQLKKIIREEYRKVLIESSSPSALFDRFQSLQRGNTPWDVQTFRRYGLEKYTQAIQRDLEYYGADSHTPPIQIEEVADEYDELKKQFKRVNITTQTDMRYGRKRYAMEHIPSGERFSLGTDRKGSLGS